jgi:sterol desaturase/sphingolipid hydroxylase (fatty acid hydroxylase superfamily)
MLLGGADALIWVFENVVRPSARAVKHVFTNPLTYVALTAILTVERFLPAKRNQKILSVGFAHDTIWFLFDVVSQSTIIAAIATFWQAVYREHFSFLTIRALEHYPFWLRLTIAILVADFAGWLHHYMRHKVWWLWPFHAVHHSQKELNLFTAVRYHVLEYMLTTVIYVFFFGVITMSPHVVVYYSLFYNWYTKMTHANIKSDFGILRYLLVTPQSHRIHHSFLPQHHDKNLGIVFSIWDYIFGTQYRTYDEYPDSGIADETFPHEEEYEWRHLIWTFIKQHFYPFQAIRNAIHAKQKLSPVIAGSVIDEAALDTTLDDKKETKEMVEALLAREKGNRLFKTMDNDVTGREWIRPIEKIKALKRRKPIL